MTEKRHKVGRFLAGVLLGVAFTATALSASAALLSPGGGNRGLLTPGLLLSDGSNLYPSDSSLSLGTSTVPGAFSSINGSGTLELLGRAFIDPTGVAGDSAGTGDYILYVSADTSDFTGASGNLVGIGSFPTFLPTSTKSVYALQLQPIITSLATGTIPWVATIDAIEPSLSYSGASNPWFQNTAILRLTDAGGKNASSTYAIYSSSTNPSYFAGNIGIGTTQPSSTLHVKGGISVNRTTYPASSTIAATDHIVAVTATSSSPVVLTLPSATSSVGREYVVKDEAGNAATGNIRVVGTGADTIDGDSSSTIITNYGITRLYSAGGSAWFTY